MTVWLASMLLLMTVSAQAQGSLDFSWQFPYYLGKTRDYVNPGGQAAALFNVENRSINEQTVEIKIALPPGFSFAGKTENWKVERDSATGKVVLVRQDRLEGGYGEWFDLLVFQVAESLPPGFYPVSVLVGEDKRNFMVEVANRGLSGYDAADLNQGNTKKVQLTGMVLPLDKDGRTDERIGRNTLVLRDRHWDYYKNLLAGKGASNQEIEAIHPVTHLGLDVHNPLGVQKLAVVTIRLLDASGKKYILGLFTPGATSEDTNGGAIDGHKNYLEALIALNGDVRQRLHIPMFADERYLNSGEYVLQAELRSEEEAPVFCEEKLNVIKKDNLAMCVVAVSTLVVIAGAIWALFRLRRLLLCMKTRWLVTIALFGAAAFATVNVPTTLLNDFFHIIMGPFSFIVSGLFSGVCLYMMVVALVILIPRPGVVALMTVVRMLLGMLAFGQISPISILSYGLHALLLELLLSGSGMYSWLQRQEGENIPPGRIMLLAGSCAVADVIATYAGLQAMSFLYRLYYATWYIALVLLFSGLIYTAIGAVCGSFLGRRLSRVGGD